MNEPLPEIRVVPHGVAARGVVDAPRSKSHAIRLLIAAGLARGTTRITDVPANDDSKAVIGALRGLGIDLAQDGDDVIISGCGGVLPIESARLDLRGSGTGLRLLTAVCCLGTGPYVLDGDASLRARPLGGVEDVVRQLGCSVVTRDGAPPVTVSGGPARRVPPGGLSVDASRSSQPLTAALLVAGALPGAASVRPTGAVVSSGYVGLTEDVLVEFERSVSSWHESHGGAIELGGSGLHADDLYSVDGDWSSGAFLLGAAAATGGDVAIRRLRSGAGQPDEAIVAVLRDMGARVDVETARFDDVRGFVGENAVRCVGRTLLGLRLSLQGSPDLAPLVGALGCVAKGVTEVTDTPHLRIKESDRIASVVAAARAIGCEAEERPDGFVIHGGGGTGGVVDPRGDHRIAMAFAVAGLAIPGVRIADPGCVAKSYPGFWDDLARLTGEA